MSAPAPEPFAWSPRRLWVCVALLLAAQIWAIHHLSRTPPPQPSAQNAPPAEVSWTLQPTPLGDDEMASNLLSIDPTLFALPDPRGFSGPLWTAPSPPEYRPPAWSDPPKFLSLAASELGPAVPVASPDRGFPAFSAFGDGQPSSEALGLYPPIETPETNSALVLPTELALRGLATPVALPAWPSAEMVSNSTVRVGVNSAGAVCSCVLTSRSGRPEADAAALAAAKRLRFRPVSNDGTAVETEAGPVLWGDLVFSWAMLPATNLAAAAASPP